MAVISKRTYFKKLSNLFDKDYVDFILLIRSNYDDDEYEKIKKAYEFASDKHKNQVRKSGEPYINHPLNVACYLANAGFDADTVCGGLLHDVVEDTKTSIEEIEELFGKDISVLVDGVTKIKRNKKLSKTESKILTHYKIINGVSNDARIIAIKLVDRLHNMYTLDYMPLDKQLEITKETEEFYVNLARILGVYQIKDDLQDLCLSYYNPNRFLELYEARHNLRNSHFDEYLYLNDEMKYRLNKQGINVTSDYKIKNIGGMEFDLLKGMKVSDIKDLVAIRILLDDTVSCYKALDELLKIKKPIKGTYTDLIKEPKYNGYKSLNVNLSPDTDISFQARIRTKDMQKINDLGLIRNWTPDMQERLNKKFSSMIDKNYEELKEKEVNNGKSK